MATNRVTLQDAIADVALRTARSNTALVRIGTIVSVAGPQAQVSVGGSTFTATLLHKVVAGDVCALLVDTDAWWVLGKVGGTGPTQ